MSRQESKSDRHPCRSSCPSDTCSTMEEPQGSASTMSANNRKYKNSRVLVCNPFQRDNKHTNCASEVNCWTCRTRCYWQLMWCISLSDGERRRCMRHQLHQTTCYRLSHHALPPHRCNQHVLRPTVLRRRRFVSLHPRSSTLQHCRRLDHRHNHHCRSTIRATYIAYRVHRTRDGASHWKCDDACVTEVTASEFEKQASPSITNQYLCCEQVGEGSKTGELWLVPFLRMPCADDSWALGYPVKRHRR